ncbi:Nudix hydrolase [Rhynchospora pubera]|uniref:Nudix hydrolase n=2 Tax=Rhynchospora pubera TaxID=906938 RepID=A0AAV8DUC6_9POAL|nr:Nudix hydrolase [Rhynchospora pubera]
MAFIWSNSSSLKVNDLPQLRVQMKAHFGLRIGKHASNSIIKSPCVYTSIVEKRFPLLKKIKEKSINVTISDKQLSEVKDILDFIEDDYEGVIINCNSLPDASNLFAAALQSSLSYWKYMGKKGVWLRILKEQADLVPVALKSGFCYHHAEPGYVMLTYWIPDGPCLLPSTGTHQIGVGAFVINNQEQVLVVKEKKGPSWCSGIWKIPTGFINKSEDIFSGAIREVKEETGIETSFLEVVAFRHAHQVIFDKSDILFICLLKPLTFDVSIDTTEIEDAMWMPLDEFLNQQVHNEDQLSGKIINICMNMFENNHRGFKVEQLTSKLDNQITHLYSLALEASPKEQSPESIR